ncbi:MAG: hypothetical protein AUJ58_11260 [Zetaproteobacteria bacterium CG1_02_55_237]|nr:MAG: hypothetical protein AUJ58_11260 [Zetaproteobacteria bacterium CG1_02_55_237]
MNAIEVYKQGYEEGTKERNSGLLESLVDGLAGIASHGLAMSDELNEAYSKGYQDGLKADKFNPPTD